MKKFWQFFKMNFEYFLEYRTDIFISFIIKLMVFLAFLFVWKTIDNEGKTIKGYGFHGIMFYYLAANILSGFVTSNAARNIRANILRGYLSTKLVKPLSIYFYYLAKHGAYVLSETLLNLLIAMPIFILWRSVSDEVFLDVYSVSRFCISSLLATLFGFNIYFLVGLSSFWTKQSYGFQLIVRNATRFFTGALIPLDLLPMWFQNITSQLPFSYMLFYPVKQLMEETTFSDFLHSMLIISIWIVVFIILNIIVWKKGIKHYESVGI